MDERPRLRVRHIAWIDVATMVVATVLVIALRPPSRFYWITLFGWVIVLVSAPFLIWMDRRIEENAGRSSTSIDG